MKTESAPCAKRPAANRDASSVKSKIDWTRPSSGTVGNTTPEQPEAGMHHTLPGTLRHSLKTQSVR